MSSELDTILDDVGVAEVIVKLTDAAVSNQQIPRAAGTVSASLAIRAIPDVMGLFISREEIQMPPLAHHAWTAVSSRRVSRRRRTSVAGLAATDVSQPSALEQEIYEQLVDPTSATRRRAAPSDIVATLFPKLGLAIGLVNRPAADALREHPSVAVVVVAPKPRLIRPVLTVKSSLSAVPAQVTWGLNKMNVPQLWNRGITGNGVVVGHLDTGVDGGHPALAGAISNFAEFDMAGKQIPKASPHDSGNHGTHTAGTIAGRPVNGKSIGVAPGASLASGLVIEGGDTITRILSGMEWMVGLNVRILSMSLGVPGYTPTFRVIIDALRNNNVLPVVAVGNEGPRTSRSPGNYDTVLSVGAFGENNQVANFSGSDSFARPVNPNVPSLVAPGVDVISCVPNNGYYSNSGTSMATPHVAGLAALLLQAAPNATLQQLEDAIVKSCARPAGMTAERGGAGIPDAVRALTAILGGNALPPITASVQVKASRKKKAVSKAREGAKGALKRLAGMKKTVKARKSGRQNGKK